MKKIVLLIFSGVLISIILGLSPTVFSNKIKYISGFEIAQKKYYQELVFYRGNKEKKEIALTFDDGPSPLWTSQVLEILKKHNIKATFFLLGKNVKKYPDLVKRIYEEGHNIGAHTYSHLNILTCKKPRAIFEIEETHRQIKEITNYEPYLFRPPYGAYQKKFYHYLKQYNYKIILWTISAEDWNGDGAKKIQNRVLSQMRNGSIILFHDGGGNRSPTIEVLNTIIEKTKNMGYNFVTIEEMFFKEKENKLVLKLEEVQ